MPSASTAASAGWRLLVGRSLRSVKVMACPTSPSSAAARAFWDANVPLVKHLNPSFGFLLRAAPQLEPYLVVEYDLAYKVKVPLVGLDADAIERKMDELVRAADEMPRSPLQSGAAMLQPSVIE